MRENSYIKIENVVSLGERLLFQHGTLGEIYHAIDERYQDESRESLLFQMPADIQERINEVGQNVPKEKLNQLVVDMCTLDL